MERAILYYIYLEATQLDGSPKILYLNALTDSGAVRVLRKLRSEGKTNEMYVHAARILDGQLYYIDLDGNCHITI